MRSLMILVTSTLLSLALISSANAAGKYESNYDVSDYYDAIVNAGLQRALEMAEEQLREKLVSIVNDPVERDRLLRKLAGKALEKIAEIINDESKSDYEKAVSVTDTIAKSMSEYDSGQTGSLDLSLRYSPQFLATEISWDRKVEHLSCHEFKVTMDCKFNSYTGFRECSYGGYYEDVEYTIEPAYRIYRVVDGKRTLLTRINGQRFVGEVQWSTKPSEWVNQIKGLLSKSDNKYADLGRSVHFDFDGDIREKGTTLSYVVEADPGSVWNESSLCDSAKSYKSSVVFDSNGDGYADFLPKSEYSLPDLSVAISSIAISGRSMEVKSVIENKGNEKADVVFEFDAEVGLDVTSAFLGRENGSCNIDRRIVKCQFTGLEPQGVLEVFVLGSANIGWAMLDASVKSVNKNNTAFSAWIDPRMANW